jgi:3-oxoacyl-[acyl-carrier protein] reductase
MSERLVIPDLRGKRVLVTGGSMGIGAAVARGFGAQGAHVAVHAHRSIAEAEKVAADIRDAGGTAVVVTADLGRKGGAAPLVSDSAARLGGLDVLINNAGTTFARRQLTEMPESAYDEVLDLNLRSMFEATRAAIPIFRAGGGGTVISTTSIAARHGGGPGAGMYAAAKAGVSNLTRSFAKELAAEGIRVNAVAPGIIWTRIHEEHSTPDMMKAFVATIPMARMGGPEECVGTYLFLASAAFSGYITGQTIEVNGGQIMP